MKKGNGFAVKGLFRVGFLALALALSALLLVSTGCLEGDSDGDTDGDTDGDGGDQTEACEKCVADECSEEITACENDVHCAQILGCMQGCTQGDMDACVTACVQAHMEGAVFFEPLADCVDDNCPACTGDDDADGDDGDDGDDDGLNTCQSCASEKCPSQVSACENDPACEAIMDCFEGCGGGDFDQCYEDCLSANPDGADLFEDLAGCAEIHCPVCSGGDDDDQVVPDDGACDDCARMSCAAQFAACMGDPNCAAIMVCMEECAADADDMSACVEPCVGENPDGAMLFGVLSDCVDDNCPVCRGE